MYCFTFIWLFMIGHRSKRYFLSHVQAERARNAESPVHDHVHAEACAERHQVRSIVNTFYYLCLIMINFAAVVRFGLDLADSLGLKLPTTATSNAEYEKAIQRGNGDADFSAIFESVSASVRKQKTV
jgi:hypothetical protein